MLQAVVLVGGSANPHQEFLALEDPRFRDYGFSNMLGTVARTLSWNGLGLWKGSVTML